MPRVYTRLATVVAALFCLSNGSSFGAGMSCKRVDLDLQRLKFVSGNAGAASSFFPTNDLDGQATRTSSHETLVVFGIGAVASSGGSFASQASTLSVENPSPWGATNIVHPQVSFSMGTEQQSQVDSSDLFAGAGTKLTFGASSNPCRATGGFQTIGPATTGTFTGLMDIIMTFNPVSGTAWLDAGEWYIACGSSWISGTLAPGGAGWNVTGTTYVSGVPQNINAVWALDVNTVITPTQSAILGQTFRISVEAEEFWMFTSATPTGSTYSSLSAGMSLTSSFSIQP